MLKLEGSQAKPPPPPDDLKPQLTSALEEAEALLTALLRIGDQPQLNNRIENLRGRLVTLSGIIESKKTASYDFNTVADELSQLREFIDDLKQRVSDQPDSNTQEAVAARRDQLSDIILQMEELEASITQNILAALEKLSLESFPGMSDFISQFGRQLEEHRAHHFARLAQRSVEALQKLDQHLIEHRKDFEKELSSIRTEQQQLQDALKKEASKLIETLKGYNQQAKDTVGDIGANSTGGGFMKAATAAQISKALWNCVAVGCLAIMTVCALKALSSDTTWGILERLAVFPPLLLLAGYAATQAAHARKADQQHRRTALEFAALTSFVAPLPEEKAHEIRSLMAQRTFGREFSSEKAGEVSPALLDSVVNKDMVPLLVQLLVEALRKKDKP